MFPPWNDALDAQLRKLLVDEGLTAKQASAVMKRPAGGINLPLHRESRPVAGPV